MRDPHPPCVARPGSGLGVRLLLEVADGALGWEAQSRVLVRRGGVVRSPANRSACHWVVKGMVRGLPQWVDVVCTETDPRGVDRVVDASRDLVLPAAADLPGCRVATLLVDRDDGRPASAVTSDSCTMLDPVRTQGAPVHDPSGAGVLVDPDHETDHEPDIADMRCPSST